MGVRTLLTGLGVGAGWMYLGDPQVGRRRRALLRDQAAGAIRNANCWFDKALRDLQHRAEGTVAELRGMFAVDAPSDEQLSQRVRAKLGHVASHARIIEVHARDCRVTLAGQAPADEIEAIASCVAAVRGVRSVDNQLRGQSETEGMPNGRAHRRPAPPMNVMGESWAPGTQLALGALGGVLMLNCLARRTPKAILLGTLGFGLFIRAATNRELGRVIEEGAETAKPMMDRMQGRTESDRSRDTMTLHKSRF